MFSHIDREFWKMVFNVKDSITPHITFRVLTFALISSVSIFLIDYFKPEDLPHNFVQYAGVVVGIMIVFRLNAGYTRWWEAREIWGGMVNQCRNLALLINSAYSDNFELKNYLLDIIATVPYVSIAILRNEKYSSKTAAILGAKREREIFRSIHPLMELLRPFFEIIHQKKNDYSVHLKLIEKGGDLIDSIGKCERILKTPLPLVAAIKVRRFVTIYLITIPLGLYDALGWFTPLFTVFLAYPFLSLDQLGRELENPFQVDRIGHLPLLTIAETIETNVSSLKVKENNPLKFATTRPIVAEFSS